MWCNEKLIQKTFPAGRASPLGKEARKYKETRMRLSEVKNTSHFFFSNGIPLTYYPLVGENRKTSLSGVKVFALARGNMNKRN